MTHLVFAINSHSTLCQPHSSISVSNLPVPALSTSSHSDNSPLSPSVTPSLFHSLAQNSPLPQIFPTTDFFPAPGPFILFFFSFLHYSFYLLVLCGRLSWLFVSFWVHAHKCSLCSLSYCIVSYRNVPKLNRLYEGKGWVLRGISSLHVA